MTATHNALLGALSRHSHLSEFSEPLDVRGNIYTPQQRRNLALQNLIGGSGEFIGENGVLQLSGNTLATQAGSGITGGSGTIYKSGVVQIGGIYKSAILIDLTGLTVEAVDLDIIGVDGGANPAHLGQVTAARNGGVILTGRMTCLEVPAGASADIDLYSATEATGAEGTGIGTLTETALLTAGGAWTLALTRAFSGFPAANQYLYLTNGAAASAGTYTAGKFLIEFEGYDA